MRQTALFTLFICLFFFSYSQTEKVTIHFSFDSDVLLPEAVAEPDSFLAVKQPVMIYGHTDSRGSSAYNIGLSRRRVKSVKAYMEAHGFGKELFVKENARGETSLIEKNDTNEEKGLVNRRVEIIRVLPRPGLSPAKQKDPGSAAFEKSEPGIKEILENSATKIGTVVAVKNIYFIGGRHKILPASLPQLQELLKALQSNKKLEIAIQGHICCLPGKDDGLDFDTDTNDLSFQRAKAIYEYLVYSGIDKGRLSYAGFGHSLPIYPYPEADSEQRVANRRVEVKILDK